MWQRDTGTLGSRNIEPPVLLVLTLIAVPLK